MMSLENNVRLIGNLGRDPEVRTTQAGKTVCNFSMATNEKYKDRNGDMQERTEWHRVVAFGKLADVVASYLFKGKMVLVEGRLQTRKWEDRDGNKRYTTEVVAEGLKMFGDGQRQDSGGDEQGSEDYHDDSDIPF